MAVEVDDTYLAPFFMRRPQCRECGCVVTSQCDDPGYIILGRIGLPPGYSLHARLSLPRQVCGSQILPLTNLVCRIKLLKSHGIILFG